MQNKYVKLVEQSLDQTSIQEGSEPVTISEQEFFEIINNIKEQQIPVDFDSGSAGGYGFIIETLRESSLARTISFTNRGFIYLHKEKDAKYKKSNLGKILILEVETRFDKVKLSIRGLT